MPGEAEIQTKSGFMMLVPALICSNTDCGMFFVEAETSFRAEELAAAGIRKYSLKTDN